MLFELSPLALTDGDSFLKRRNMKKIFTSIILFIIVFCLGLSGCTGNGDVTDITPVEIESETAETKTDTVTETDATESEVNMWRYRQEKGIVVRDLVIETGKGGEDITVVQLTDLHLSWVTENDLADPIISKTYESRTWTKDGRFWNNAKKCLEWAKDYDQIVLTGDVYDYLSEGTVIKVKDYIFDAYDNVMACLGNHEAVKAMGEESENYWQSVLSDRMSALESSWTVNDIYYSSKVLGDKVMLIQMDNGVTGHFRDVQVDRFEADLKAARENGYAVLIFYHIPIATYNTKYYNTKPLYVGDNNTAYNFATSGPNKWSESADGAICSLIDQNGDIIKGAFSGHLHSDYYSEIIASSPDGTETRIPQYVLTGTPYGAGHTLRITIK